MKVRLLVALLALSGLPAFAPAPFPRTERRGDPHAVSLNWFQGDWRAVAFDTIGANNERTKNGFWFRVVRVRGDRWTYRVDGSDNSTYRLVIDGGRRPAFIDFFELQGQQQRPGMVGIMRREGNRVTILYYAATPEARARSFDDMPRSWWLLVLERQ